MALSDESMILHREHKNRHDVAERELKEIRATLSELQRLADFYKGVSKQYRRDMDSLDETVKDLNTLVSKHLIQEQQDNIQRTKLILKLILIGGGILLALQLLVTGSQEVFMLSILNGG